MNSIERQIILGFIGTLLVIAGMAMATYASTAKFIEKSRRVHQIHSVLSKVDAMSRNLSLAQTGQRDFMLTGKDLDLESFQDSLFSIDGQLKEIRALVRDEQQLARLESLEPLLVRKIDLLRATLNVKASRGLAAATRLMRGQDDRAVSKGIEDLLRSFRAREDELLRGQASEVEEESQAMRRMVLFGLAANLALFSLVYFMVHHEMKRRVAAENELARQTNILSSVLRNMGDAVQAVDMEGRFLVSNPAAKQLFSSGPDRLGEETFNDKLGIYQGDRVTHLSYGELPLVRAIRGQDTDDLGVYIKNARVPQGAYLSVSGRPLRGPDKEVIGGIAVYRNITEQKNGELAMLKTNTKLTELVETLQTQNEDISALSDLVETLQACNNLNEVCKASSAVMSVLFKGSSGSVYVLTADREHVERSCTWGNSPSASQGFPVEHCWAFRRSQPNFSNALHPGKRCEHFGSEPPQEALCIPLAAHGEPLGLLEVCSQLEEDKSVLDGRQRLAAMIGEQIGLALSNLRLRESLKNQSIHDPLTGLFNRRYMEESFEQELAQALRAKTNLCVAMLDVDHFKRFNDEFGHDAGDLVLKEISRLLKETLRRGDIVCRYGGEELAVLMPHSPADQAKLRMDFIRQKISDLRLFHLDRPLGVLTVSIGIGVFPEDGRTVTELLRRADEALYSAKQNGRNRVVLSSELEKKAA